MEYLTLGFILSFERISQYLLHFRESYVTLKSYLIFFEKWFSHEFLLLRINIFIGHNYELTIQLLNINY